MQLQATVQQIQGIFDQCLAVHDKLETSLHDLSRTGDAKSCKAARKAADAQFKELAKELKPLLLSVQSSPQSHQIWPKVCSTNFCDCIYVVYKKMKLRNIFSFAMSCNLNLDRLSAFILITKNKSYFLCIVATARGLGCEGE